MYLLWLPKQIVPKVLKSGPNRMVQPEKPQTAHLCDSFNSKNLSMWKMHEIARIVVKPYGSENYGRF